MPPTYRRRLRREGLALGSAGALGSSALLMATAQAQRGPGSTVVQLLGVAVLLGWLGPRSVRRALAAAEPRTRAAVGSGEPTPLWQLPLIVLLLTVVAGPVAGWDAGLRVCGGCVLVGLAQAFLMERVVERDERATGRVMFRISGSRILRGTRLGFELPAGAVEPSGGRAVPAGASRVSA